MRRRVDSNGTIITRKPICTARNMTEGVRQLITRRFLVWLIVVGVLGYVGEYIQYFQPDLRLISLILSYIVLGVFLWGFRDLIRVIGALSGITGRITWPR